MLNKKQKDRIHLADLKEMEIFKKHKIEFEKLLKTPRQSFHKSQITLSQNNKPTSLSNTPRNLNLIDLEKQAIEKDWHRKKTLHLNFQNSANSITLIDGDSVKKFPSHSLFLQKTQSAGQNDQLARQFSSPGVHSEGTPTAHSAFLRSIDSLPIDHVRNFSHASTMTDPVKVLAYYQNLAEDLDNEFRRFMALYNQHGAATQELAVLKARNTDIEGEIRDLETQRGWKATALQHAREELTQAEAACAELEGKVHRNQERAIEILTKQDQEILALEEELAFAQITLARMSLSPSKIDRPTS